MVIKKSKGKHFLLIELNSGDAKYIKSYVMYEHASMVKKAGNYLKRTIPVHIRAIFVMTAAQMLCEEGRIKQKTYDLVLRDLDKAMTTFNRQVDRYFKKFGGMLDSKPSKYKSKTKKKQ
jgi:hypothetical protein